MHPGASGAPAEDPGDRQHESREGGKEHGAAKRVSCQEAGPAQPGGDEEGKEVGREGQEAKRMLESEREKERKKKDEQQGSGRVDENKKEVRDERAERRWERYEKAMTQAKRERKEDEEGGREGGKVKKGKFRVGLKGLEVKEKGMSSKLKEGGAGDKRKKA